VYKVEHRLCRSWVRHCAVAKVAQLQKTSELCRNCTPQDHSFLRGLFICVGDCCNYCHLQKKLEERAAEVARLAQEKKTSARLQRRKWVRCVSLQFSHQQHRQLVLCLRPNIGKRGYMESGNAIFASVTACCRLSGYFLAVDCSLRWFSGRKYTWL